MTESCRMKIECMLGSFPLAFKKNENQERLGEVKNGTVFSLLVMAGFFRTHQRSESFRTKVTDNSRQTSFEGRTV